MQIKILNTGVDTLKVNPKFVGNDSLPFLLGSPLLAQPPFSPQQCETIQAHFLIVIKQQDSFPPFSYGTHSKKYTPPAPAATRCFPSG